MADIVEKIEGLDLSVFDPIASQTVDDDKLSLLAIQRAVRTRGEYVYLEIGSHLGGTLQPHLLDPRCTKIYSIDPRPFIVNDERGEQQRYIDNSTKRMIDLLSEIAPEQVHKVVTFDSDSSEIEPSDIYPKPDLCFIDGEHTNEAATKDFSFCFAVAADPAAIVFHDFDLVYKAVKQAIHRLRSDVNAYDAMKLGGSVFAISLGGSPIETDQKIRSMRKSTGYHFLRSAVRLRLTRHQIKSRLAKNARSN
jgi:hypothetical protein